jgi:hypothetical protein
VEKAGLTKAECLEEIRLGKWANDTLKRSSYTTEQRLEFNKIRKETPTYSQKNNVNTLNKLKEFIARKGYRPRSFISRADAEKTGLSKAERLEEIKLNSWAHRVRNNVIVWQYPEQRAEFNKIWNGASTYAQKNQTDKFNKWKNFIALKGYKPRVAVSKKNAERAGLTEAERLEEIKLGKWGHHTKDRPLPTAEQQAEFNKLWQETPYIQIHGRTHFRTHIMGSPTEKFNKWKKFIARKGYKPRVTVSKREAERAGLTETELAEETMLGRWANHASHGLSIAVEQQTEFNKMRDKTPTYFQKNHPGGFISRFNEWKAFIALKGYRPRETISEKDASTGSASGKMTEAERLKEISLGKWGSHTKQRPWRHPEHQPEFIKIWRETPTHTRGIYNTKTDKFNKWKEFIARKGYRPRPRISATKKAGLTEAEQAEETKLGRWADNAIQVVKGNRIGWHDPQQRAEFKKLWSETPTFFQKNTAPK